MFINPRLEIPWISSHHGEHNWKEQETQRPGSRNPFGNHTRPQRNSYERNHHHNNHNRSIFSNVRSTIYNNYYNNYNSYDNYGGYGGYNNYNYY